MAGNSAVTEPGLIRFTRHGWAAAPFALLD